MNERKNGEISSNLEAGPILVAVDFSLDSEHALRWAIAEAIIHQAPVTVLHVVHDPASAPGYYAEASEAGQVHSLEEVAQEYLDRFLEEFCRDDPRAAKVAISPMLVVGLPATRILEVANNIHARMIVVGSRGRTGLAHLFLGSKAERVIQLSPVPVTVVKAPAGPGS